LTVARHRFDADRARMLQALNEIGVDIELALAAQFRTIRIRNWERGALIDPDRERAVEHALRHQIDRQASLLAVADPDGDAATGRLTCAFRAGRSEAVRIAVGPVDANLGPRLIGELHGPRITGGFGSAGGALAGGILLGVLQALAIVLLGAGFKNVAALSVLLVVLLVFPSGLFAGLKALAAKLRSQSAAR